MTIMRAFLCFWFLSLPVLPGLAKPNGPEKSQAHGDPASSGPLNSQGQATTVGLALQSQAGLTSAGADKQAMAPTSVTPDTAADDEFSFGELSLPGLTLNELNIYGYFSTRLEKTFAEPAAANGAIVKNDAPAEFIYPSFNLLLQHQLTNKFKAFINFNGAGGGAIDLRNFWGEYAASAALNFRLGKIYRKFGLYNEILDAVPTYYGIEPPELFDVDHLMVSRTTAAMLYGSFSTSGGILNYSLSTDNGEGDPAKGTIPLGYDLHYKFGGGDYTLGFSGYTSGGKTTPDIGVGEGSPRSGVLPWMASDKFTVWGGYFEGKFNNVTVQTEYWHSPHRAVRDAEATVAMIEGAAPNAKQLARFLKNPALGATASNVNPTAHYSVQTWYVRAGLSAESKFGEIAPYAQWDHYSNPETVANKEFGGDNEAGVSDDGKFEKSTVGIVFRPAPQVAVKLDQSFHFYRLNGSRVNYWEVRFDVSLLFGQVF